MSAIEAKPKQIMTPEEKQDKRLFNEAMVVLRAAEKAEKALAKTTKKAEKDEEKLIAEAMVVLKRGEKQDAKKAKRAEKNKEEAGPVPVDVE